MEKGENHNPVDYECMISGQAFKIGRFNRVYVWRTNEWMLTRSTSLEIVKAARDNMIERMKVRRVK